MLNKIWKEETGTPFAYKLKIQTDIFSRNFILTHNI